MRLLRILSRRLSRSRTSADSSNTLVRDAAVAPAKSDHDISSRAERLEFLELVCGWIVVIGVAVEYIPQFIAWAHRPSWHTFKDLIGGVLIALGVAGEIIFADWAKRNREILSVRKDKEIASLQLLAEHERSARAKVELEVAKSNLARVQLELRLRARTIAGPEHRELIKLLSAHAGKLVDIVVFDHHIPETEQFGIQVISLFLAAKWKCRLWKPNASTYRIPGPSLLILTGVGHVNDLKGVANALANTLEKAELDCGIGLGKFGCEGEFKRTDFHLELEEPPQFMGMRIIAPLRIQIGAKQIVPPPFTTITVQPRQPSK